MPHNGTQGGRTGGEGSNKPPTVQTPEWGSFLALREGRQVQYYVITNSAGEYLRYQWHATPDYNERWVRQLSRAWFTTDVDEAVKIAHVVTGYVLPLVAYE